MRRAQKFSLLVCFLRRRLPSFPWFSILASGTRSPDAVSFVTLQPAVGSLRMLHYGGSGASAGAAFEAVARFPKGDSARRRVCERDPTRIPYSHTAAFERQIAFA